MDEFVLATQPGTLLKRQILLRTFTEWEDTGVGFFEADRVAHCGTCSAGTFRWSLVMTDLASGWTECFPLLRRTSHGVRQHDSYLTDAPPEISMLNFL